MENNKNDIVFLRKGENIITQEQIPQFKELVNNIYNADRSPLPKPPKPEVIYENNGLIGTGIGIAVLVIIVAMFLFKFI